MIKKKNNVKIKNKRIKFINLNKKKHAIRRAYINNNLYRTNKRWKIHSLRISRLYNPSLKNQRKTPISRFNRPQPASHILSHHQPKQKLDIRVIRHFNKSLRHKFKKNSKHINRASSRNKQLILII